MKNKSDGPAIVLNPPAVILVRLVFLLMVATLLGAVALLLTGAVMHDGRTLVLGALGAVATGALYCWLRRRERVRDVFDSINLIGGPAQPQEDFTRLVHAWEDLRIKRGTAEFDAWELLRLRREIEARAKDSPLLTDYWRDHQA